MKFVTCYEMPQSNAWQWCIETQCDTKKKIIRKGGIKSGMERHRVGRKWDWLISEAQSSKSGMVI